MLRRRVLAVAEKPQHQQFELIKSILVVVHMQPELFNACLCGDCLTNAEREIASAVDADEPIFLAETFPASFDDNGRTFGPGSTTHQRLLAHLKNYDDWKHFLIGETDASVEIYEAMCRRRQEPKTIRVIGVETDVCVLDHVRSFQILYPNTHIEVVRDACEIGLRFGDPWPEFKAMAPQVELI